MQFRPRARSGVLIPVGSRARRGLLAAAALLAFPAWQAPSAAQDREAPRPQDARVAVAQHLAVQAQDTVPVIRCCVQPPSRMTFWAPLNGTYNNVVGPPAGVAVGTVSWTAAPQGRPGNALSLAASGRVNYQPSANTSVGDGDFSIDAWIRLPLTNGVNTLLDNRSGPGPTVRGIGLFVYNGRIGFQMANGIGWDNFIATNVVADNVWHFVAVTVARSNPQGGRIYVDGVLVHTFNPTVRPGSLGTNSSLVIGHDIWSNAPGSPFAIDEVEFFRRVLTQAEVVALFRYPKCPPTARP
jgi:hypothetical protein